MSIIGAGIAVFLGAAGACVIVCAIHGAAAVGPAPVTQTLSRKQPWLSATEAQRLSDRQQLKQILSSELARSTHAAEPRLTRPFGRSIPETAAAVSMIDSGCVIEFAQERQIQAYSYSHPPQAGEILCQTNTLR
jgi:hypothetical protein